MKKIDKISDSVIQLIAKQGLKYSLILLLIGSLFLGTIDSIQAARHSGYEDYYNLNFISYLSSNILISSVACFLIGIPVIGITVSYASKILAEWLISDYEKEILSVGMGILKGSFVGIGFGLIMSFCLAIIAILIASPRDFLDIFHDISNFEDLFFVSLFYLPPLLGALSGYKLGEYLSKNLSAIIDPITSKKDSLHG